MPDHQAPVTQPTLARSVASATATEPKINPTALTLPEVISVTSHNLNVPSENTSFTQVSASSRVQQPPTGQPNNTILTAQPTMSGLASGPRRYKEPRNLTRWDCAYHLNLYNRKNLMFWHRDLVRNAQRSTVIYSYFIMHLCLYIARRSFC
jgi:hypothetical protein